MEAAGAIVLTVILAVPFLLQLQTSVADERSLSKFLNYLRYIFKKEHVAPEIWQYYPKESISFTATSDSKVIVAHLRPTCSSPALSPETVIEGASKQTLLPPAKQSSSFVKRERAVPVVDISWNYEWYRFKAFEASLRNRYGVNYPPGKVILNSMQLNLLDSKTRIMSRGNWSRGLFDFLKESDATLCDPLSKTLGIEYLNPLDYFVTRRCTTTITEEKSTDTKECVYEEMIKTPSIVCAPSSIESVVFERTKDFALDHRPVLRVNEISPYKVGKIKRDNRLANSKFKK